MYDGKNTSDNKGNVNVEYFLLDKVSLTEGSSYMLSFKVASDWTYKYLTNSKVKVLLRDGTSSDSKILRDLGEVDLYFDGDGVFNLRSLPIASAPAESYVCLLFTGDLVGPVISAQFSDFTIDTSVAPPTITRQPESNLNYDVDKVTTLNVNANGDNLKYQWYYKKLRISLHHGRNSDALCQVGTISDKQ